MGWLYFNQQSLLCMPLICDQPHTAASQIKMRRTRLKPQTNTMRPPGRGWKAGTWLQRGSVWPRLPSQLLPVAHLAYTWMNTHEYCLVFSTRSRGIVGIALREKDWDAGIEHWRENWSSQLGLVSPSGHWFTIPQLSSCIRATAETLWAAVSRTEKCFRLVWIVTKFSALINFEEKAECFKYSMSCTALGFK